MVIIDTIFAAISPLTGQDCTPIKTRLLGVIPKWNTFLPMRYDTSGNCTVVGIDFSKHPEQLLLIGLAVVSALMAIAGVVAFVYLLYGGFQYVVSQGEPDNAKKALETIKNALIGLVITVVASGIVSFIGHKVGGP